MTRIPFEIIRVQNASFLLNSAKQSCRYARADGGSLSPGYYLAWSPRWRTAHLYDKHVRYCGPLPTIDIARFLEKSAWALGLMPGTPARASVARRDPQDRTAASRQRRLPRAG